MDIVEKFIHADWFNTILTSCIILMATFIVSRITIRFLRRILDKTSLLPSSTIFINILRVAVWFVGIASVLSICFNVNVNGMITGLGVVGIAISLGFQDTLSNLIGGLQVSLSRSIEPGDRIRMGNSVTGLTGIVKDVNWRYTLVIDSSGNIINVPNSTITSSIVTKLSPANVISIPLVVTGCSERLTSTAHHIEDAAEKAVVRVSKLKKDPYVTFSNVSEYGYVGSLNFTIADPSKASNATDAAIRAIAPYVHQGVLAEGQASHGVGMTTSIPPVSDNKPEETEKQKPA